MYLALLPPVLTIQREHSILAVLLFLISSLRKFDESISGWGMGECKDSNIFFFHLGQNSNISRFTVSLLLFQEKLENAWDKAPERTNCFHLFRFGSWEEVAVANTGLLPTSWQASRAQRSKRKDWGNVLRKHLSGGVNGRHWDVVDFNAILKANREWKWRTFSPHPWRQYGLCKPRVVEMWGWEQTQENPSSATGLVGILG